KTQVVNLLADACEIRASSVNLQTQLQDLGVDSLMLIEFAGKLHALLPDLSLTARNLSTCGTVADVVQMVVGNLTSHSTASSPKTPVSDQADVNDIDVSIDKVPFLGSQSREKLDYSYPSLWIASQDLSTLFQSDNLPCLLQQSSSNRSPLFLFHDGS